MVSDPPPPTDTKVEYGPTTLAKAFAVWKNHLLSLLLRKRLLKSGSISSAWAFRCCAILMQRSCSGPFVVLNSLRLDGCALNNVRQRTMLIADAALRLIVREPQTLFTTGCSPPGVLPFSLCFLFFVYQVCFPSFSVLLFLLEADCCLS